MTREQLELFGESLGNGWYFRAVTEGGWGIWRNIKSKGCPPEYYTDEDVAYTIADVIHREQQVLCIQDKNGLTVSGRSGGWFGWPYLS